jgi:hypothetical protein
MGKYAHITDPATIFLDSDSVDAPYSVYRSGDNYVFNGYGGAGATIQLAYYEYPRRLKYYKNDTTRPAMYDEDLESWSYQAPYSADIAPNNKAKAQDLTTNWILMRWEDLVLAGVRAKAYSRAGDQDRSRAAYSIFENSRSTFIAAESMEFIGFYRG